MIMPFSMLKACSYPGCTTLVRTGRCKEHPYLDAHDAESEKLYHTARWARIRKRQLAKDPWCAQCLLQDVYTPATVVDHVIPHRGDPVKFYRGPFQSLCKTCHDRKTAKEVLNG